MIVWENIQLPLGARSEGLGFVLIEQSEVKYQAEKREKHPLAACRYRYWMVHASVQPRVLYDGIVTGVEQRRPIGRGA